MVEEDMEVHDIWGEQPVSVPEVIEEHMLAIYPNPALSILKISADDVRQLTVYSITGQMLIHLQNTNTVNVSDLPNGLYIIQVTTPNGTVAHRFYVAR